MKFDNVELPSNKKFGFFFSAVFLVVSLYFYFEGNVVITYVFSISSLLFFMATLIKSDVLAPLNSLWMRFGVLLGMIVSPFVLGLIFFGLFTPLSICMRILGRDELHLKFKPQRSHWITRDSQTIEPDTFKQQF